MKEDYAAMPAGGLHTGLPSSSLSERGVCSPTATVGRPVCGSARRGFSTGAAMSSHAQVEDGQDLPGTHVPSAPCSLKPKIAGKCFPEEIQCS